MGNGGSTAITQTTQNSKQSGARSTSEVTPAGTASTAITRITGRSTEAILTTMVTTILPLAAETPLMQIGPAVLRAINKRLTAAMTFVMILFAEIKMLVLIL